jgi:hypothetical protein
MCTGINIVFLAVNWRPPSSGDANYTTCKNAQECRPYRPLEYGVNYRETVARILDTINTLQSLTPSWSTRAVGDGLVSRLRRRRQCTKDCEYGENLSQLIRNLRLDLEAPHLPVVVGELGMEGVDPDVRGRDLRFREIQLNVTLMPEFRRTTRFA